MVNGELGSGDQFEETQTELSSTAYLEQLKTKPNVPELCARSDQTIH
jgi:hypothetical protein